MSLSRAAKRAGDSITKIHAHMLLVFGGIYAGEICIVVYYFGFAQQFIVADTQVNVLLVPKHYQAGVCFK